MKAIVYYEYGSPDVLQLAEISKPTPKPNELLVKVNTTSVSYGEIAARTFANVSPSEFNMPSLFWLLARFSFGWRKPKNPILGIEFAGIIEAVGTDVTTYKPGDVIFGYRGQAMGCHTEYICVPADGLIAHKPAHISDAEAAVIPYGALTALTLLRRLNIQQGQRVLINGASGRIGSFAVQLAKHAGAHVTAVCGTARTQYVKALGADEVLDYTRDDFTKSGEAYDLIFDVLGRSSFEACKAVLKPQGVYFPVSFKWNAIRQALATRNSNGQRVKIGLSDEKPADMQTIKQLIEAGAIKAFVDRCYPLEQTADAHRYYESNSRAGNVVIMVAEQPHPLAPSP
jgi:NADPH:quinone reductase-like Zn-dependent oxidoreductase